MELGPGGGSGGAGGHVCALCRSDSGRRSDTLANHTWEQLAAADAEVASIVSRLLVVLGLLGVAFGALSLVVALVPYRLGARWAWYALLLVPVTYGAIAARQLSDQYAIGYFYAALAAVAGIGLLLEIPRIRRQPGVESGRLTEG